MAPEPVTYRRLLPPGDELDAPALLDGIFEGLEAPGERPFLVANFVASADGRATVEGRSGGLGDDGDKAIFHGLREQVDAVLVGTNTLRIENYGRILGKPERRARRTAAGRTSEPLTCLITKSGKLPLGIPLFAEPEARMIVFCATDTELSLEGAAARVEVTRLHRDELTPAAALAHLRAHHAVTTVLCEGGPTLFGSLLRERLVDELFLTLAPKLAGGGEATTIASGPALDELATISPKCVLERHGTLYLRYALTS